MVALLIIRIFVFCQIIRFVNLSEETLNSHSIYLKDFQNGYNNSVGCN